MYSLADLRWCGRSVPHDTGWQYDGFKQVIACKRPRAKADASINAAKRITVLLADDNLDLRQVLRVVLEIESDIEVVGDAINGRDAVAMALKLRPDVVVMDIAMPLLNGLEATRQIHQAAPSVKVLILSAHSDSAYVERATAFGAAGYLIKQTSVHVLAEAIREVQKGNIYLSPAIAKTLGRRSQKSLDRTYLSGAKVRRSG